MKTDEVFETIDSIETDLPSDLAVTESVQKPDSQTNTCVQESEDRDAEIEAVEEVDLEELARDKLIEEILVYTVKGCLPKPPASKEEAEQEIKERLSTLDVKVVSMKTICDKRGYFEQSRVKTTAVNLKNIWGRRPRHKNFAVMAFEPPAFNK